MKNLEWNNTDKSAWGPGPWQDEPDKMQFEDEDTGLPCLIVRNNGGALCGYVGVPESHPWHGVEYCGCTLPTAKPRGHKKQPQHGDDYTHFEDWSASVTVCSEEWCGHTPESRIEVHGGLTFSGECGNSDDPSKHICHLPDDGETDDIWWFGFDCAHCDDKSPAYESSFNFGGMYKGVEYVKSEIRSLARQLAAVAPPEEQT